MEIDSLHFSGQQLKYIYNANILTEVANMDSVSQNAHLIDIRYFPMFFTKCFVLLNISLFPEMNADKIRNLSEEEWFDFVNENTIIKTWWHIVLKRNRNFKDNRRGGATSSNKKQKLDDDSLEASTSSQKVKKPKKIDLLDDRSKQIILFLKKSQRLFGNSLEFDEHGNILNSL